MSIRPDFIGPYSSKKDELLLCEGERTSSVILMLKGKLDVLISPHCSEPDKSDLIQNKSCKLFTLEQSTFVGINDIINSRDHSLTIKSADDSSLFVFKAGNANEIKNLISVQKDYATYMVTSLANLITQSYNAYHKLLPLCRNVDILTHNLSIYYWAIKDKYYFQYSPNNSTIDDYSSKYEAAKNQGVSFFPVGSEAVLKKINDRTQAESDTDLDINTIEYFTKLLNIPLEQRKGFFNSESFICEYHIQKGSEVLDALLQEIKGMLAELCININQLYLMPDSIFSTFGRIVVDSRDDKEAALNAYSLLEQCAEVLYSNIEMLQNDFACLSSINISQISEFVEDVKEQAAIGNDGVSGPSDETVELPQELENSLENILLYCNCSHDVITSVSKRLSQFRAIKDKSSMDPDVRDLRSSLANDFFVFYEEAFKRTQKDKYCPKLISMFLNFGYMDERLLTKEQTLALYRLCDKEYADTKYSVFSSKAWLEAIFTGKREPSINDFGQDYFDLFRDMKKKKMVSDQDKAAYDKDFDAKANFEISNMLKTNQKVCHGHISSYFPILHKDIITRDIEKSLITPIKLEQAINKVLETDFSVFFREVWYKNDAKNIEKEPIMKEILPDIILVPTFGSRASMWQEISGRSRNTPGRFILPALTDENLDDMVLKLLGAFKWELCRTMMGVAWNDITEKSLTSEYTDYIQFFKKNHDLTEEAKDKIKIQIQKNRNMMKDIFTSDYDTWINYESKGILRLNKVARSILFRYCPLPKEARGNLSKQPAFTDLVMQMNAARTKAAKSLTAKYAKMFKDSPIDRDMELNLIFYRDM